MAIVTKTLNKTDFFRNGKRPTTVYGTFYTHARYNKSPILLTFSLHILVQLWKSRSVLSKTKSYLDATACIDSDLTFFFLLNIDIAPFYKFVR